MINRDPKNHISLQDWATTEMLVPMFEEERERARDVLSYINKFTQYKFAWAKSPFSADMCDTTTG